MLRRWRTGRGGIMICPTDKTGATGAEHNAIQSPCEIERWCWSRSVVMLGFRTAGKWAVGLHSRVSSNGIGKGVACLAKRFWKALRLF